MDIGILCVIVLHIILPSKDPCPLTIWVVLTVAHLNLGFGGLRPGIYELRAKDLLLRV